MLEQMSRTSWSLTSQGFRVKPDDVRVVERADEQDVMEKGDSLCVVVGLDEGGVIGICKLRIRGRPRRCRRGKEGGRARYYEKTHA